MGYSEVSEVLLANGADLSLLEKVRNVLAADYSIVHHALFLAVGKVAAVHRCERQLHRYDSDDERMLQIRSETALFVTRAFTRSDCRLADQSRTREVAPAVDEQRFELQPQADRREEHLDRVNRHQRLDHVRQQQ